MPTTHAVLTRIATKQGLQTPREIITKMSLSMGFKTQPCPYGCNKWQVDFNMDLGINYNGTTVPYTNCLHDVNDNLLPALHGGNEGEDLSPAHIEHGQPSIVSQETKAASSASSPVQAFGGIFDREIENPHLNQDICNPKDFDAAGLDHNSLHANAWDFNDLHFNDFDFNNLDFGTNDFRQNDFNPNNSNLNDLEFNLNDFNANESSQNGLDQTGLTSANMPKRTLVPVEPPSPAVDRSTTSNEPPYQHGLNQHTRNQLSFESQRPAGYMPVANGAFSHELELIPYAQAQTPMGMRNSAFYTPTPHQTSTGQANLYARSRQPLQYRFIDETRSIQAQYEVEPLQYHFIDETRSVEAQYEVGAANLPDVYNFPQVASPGSEGLENQPEKAMPARQNRNKTDRKCPSRLGASRPAAWTEDELLRADALRKQGVAIKDIATGSGRSYDAVFCRLQRLDKRRSRDAHKKTVDNTDGDFGQA